jgi:hypothetical protein
MVKQNSLLTKFNYKTRSCAAHGSLLAVKDASVCRIQESSLNGASRLSVKYGHRCISVVTRARNVCLEVTVYFLKSKQGYSVRKWGKKDKWIYIEK